MTDRIKGFVVTLESDMREFVGVDLQRPGDRAEQHRVGAPS